MVATSMSEVRDELFEKIVLDLQSEDFYLGCFAAEDLESYGEKAIRPLIEATLNGKNMLVKISATAVLMRIGHPVVEHMLLQLKDENLREKRIAIEFLTYLGGKDVIPHLAELLTHEHKSMRWMAEESIKFLRKEPYDEKFTPSPISPSKQGVYDELRKQYEAQL